MKRKEKFFLISILLYFYLSLGTMLQMKASLIQVKEMEFLLKFNIMFDKHESRSIFITSERKCKVNPNVLQKFRETTQIVCKVCDGCVQNSPHVVKQAETQNQSRAKTYVKQNNPTTKSQKEKIQFFLYYLSCPLGSRNGRHMQRSCQHALQPAKNLNYTKKAINNSGKECVSCSILICIKKINVQCVM